MPIIILKALALLTLGCWDWDFSPLLHFPNFTKCALSVDGSTVSSREHFGRRGFPGVHAGLSASGAALGASALPSGKGPFLRVSTPQRQSGFFPQNSLRFNHSVTAAQKHRRFASLKSNGSGNRSASPPGRKSVCFKPTSLPRARRSSFPGS